jgi:hypothetical protein
MYAKIVALLVLFLGSLTGVHADSRSATNDNWTNDIRLEENVQVQVLQEKADQVHLPNIGGEPRREELSEEAPLVNPLIGCHTTNPTPNPDVASFAVQLGLSYESVLSWYCSGFSFETIQAVYDMSVMAGVTIEQIYEMRVLKGLTWNEVLLELGITFSRNGPPMILDEADRNRSDG